MSSPTERLVEDIAAVYFGTIGASTRRGVEIDDAGERSNASEVTLKGRLDAALHRLNPDLPVGADFKLTHPTDLSLTREWVPAL